MSKVLVDLEVLVQAVEALDGASAVLVNSLRIPEAATALRTALEQQWTGLHFGLLTHWSSTWNWRNEMKYDYWLPRKLVTITGIVFIVQLLTEVVGTRKPEFWWVLPACASAFGLSVLYAALLIVLSARMK